MSLNIKLPKSKISKFCSRNHIKSLSLFGSVLRDDFTTDSDIDILVEFGQDETLGLMDLARIENELSAMFGRKVDLVERQSVEASENYIRRKHILESVETVYVA